MHKKKMLLIIVSTFIIPFLLFGQIREEAERIHELFLHGSINETDEVLLHLIIKETHTITGSCIRNSETKTDIRGTFNDGGEDIQLTEFSNGTLVGKIRGQLFGTHFSGTWTLETGEAPFDLTLFSVAVIKDTNISPVLNTTARYPYFFDNADINNEIQKQIVDDTEMCYDDIDLMYGPDYNPGFTIQSDFRFVCVRENFVSIEFLYYAYTGGAHGNWQYQTLNFLRDKTRAQLITVEQFFRNDSAAEAYLSATILSDLAEQEAFFVTDGMVTELTFSDLQAFTLSKTGITFLFSPYQVGSFAQGGFEVFIPYTDVEEYIDLEVLNEIQYCHEYPDS